MLETVERDTLSAFESNQLYSIIAAIGKIS